MRHGSLFSGIGGFDLAAQWMGWENVFHCEWNPFGQKVLKYYWPNAISYEDITKSDFTIHRGTIDILTGGFPCQPFSTAGKREGTDDARYLWPEMRRVIREVRPRYIVGENVRGLVNWSGGMVFDTVCADLEAEGYEILPVLLPAAGVNAPHRRDRIWFIARKSSDTASIGLYQHSTKQRLQFETFGTQFGMGQRAIAHSNHKGGGDGLGQIQGTDGEISERNNHAESCDSDQFNAADTQRIRFWSLSEENTSNSDSQMLEHRNGERKTGGRTITEERIKSFDGPGDWETFPTVSPVCNGDDGLSNRLDGITFSKWRKESIRGGGNAILPQIAFQIFKVIQKMENK